MNLLALALTVIPPQTVRYYAFTGKSTSPSGRAVPEYAPGVDRQGSFQPVSRSRMEREGLDMDRSYAVFYGPGTYRTAARNSGPDQFGFDGRRWEAQDVADWATYDGWSGVLCVDVGADA